MPTLDDARTIGNAIAEALKPEAVILFGSVAKSGFGHDLDFLIVAEDQDEALPRVSMILESFYQKWAIDYFVVSSQWLRAAFRKGSPFLRMVQREGKVLFMKDSLAQWISHAREELSEAEYLRAGGFCRGACYHAQQAVEKGLKAALLERGWELERIHSVRRLMVLARDYGLRLDLHEEDVDFLDSIYRSRYPADEGLLPLGVPTEQDARRALDAARSILRQLRIVE
uniref:HEPN domain-containing protein n=1 Tax=Desulfacinum infernum TaxID=35837 RepID=A0A832A1B4_9BACT